LKSLGFEFLLLFDALEALPLQLSYEHVLQISVCVVDEPLLHRRLPLELGGVDCDPLVQLLSDIFR